MINHTLRKTLTALIAILCLLASAGAFAQEQSAVKKHCLWKVRSKKNTVYIAGSVHVMKEDVYPLDKVFDKAYEDSKRFFFEVNLDEMDSSNAQQMMIEKGLYPEGVTLKDKLSKKAYDEAREKLADMGFNIAQVETLRPWMISVTIASAKLQLLGYDPSRGIDRYFYEKAKKDGKKVAGFETLEYQLGLFGDMSDKMQELMLLQTLKELDDMESEVGLMIDAWKNGDSNMLEKSLLKSFDEYPEVYKALIEKRNGNWLPRIESLIGEGENSMIVVGAAHLIGKDGIIPALKSKGYAVEQQ